MYDPAIWRDFFVMVGGGAAALTGLVFVAMTLHHEDIVFFGAVWGLYIVGVGMMASFVFMVTGAWLLLVGVESDQASRKLGNPEEVAGLAQD